MNWEMAKNWLIVAFFLLDLILGWQVYESRKELKSYVESYSDQVANTRTLLAEHGFSLDASVPANHPDMSFLRADFSTPSLASLAKTTFPNSKTYTVEQGEGVQSEQGVLKLLDNGQWTVTYRVLPEVSSEDPSTISRYFWNGQGYVLDDSRSARDDKEGHGARLAFLLQFDSFPIFDATATAVVKDHHLSEYTQVFLGNMATSGDKKPTITALDALNNLANAVDKSMLRPDNRIIDIKLGYYHKLPKAAGQSEGMPATTYWFPVWRIETEQQVFYVNAFTGEVDMSF
jgi:regulatory protein YycI of two-component signal transduction system YycFG